MCYNQHLSLFRRWLLPGTLKGLHCKHESCCPGGAFLYYALLLPYRVCDCSVLLEVFASVMHMILGADTGLLGLMY